MSRNLRNRSSRYSSPATFTAVNHEGAPPVQETVEVQRSAKGENGIHRLQSRLDNWVEPAVRNGIASFEDTRGLERVGVLEHMQPLGVAPNQKLLQKLKVNTWRPSLSARDTPVYSEGVASPSVEPAKDASPAIDPELLLDAPPLEPETEPETEMEMETEAGLKVNRIPAIFEPDEQLDPESPSSPRPQPLPLPVSQPQAQSHSHKQTHTAFSSDIDPPSAEIQAFLYLHENPLPPPIITSPPRGRPAKKEVEEMRVYPGPQDMAFSPVSTGLHRSSRASPRFSLSAQDSQKTDRFRGYMMNAINRANSEGKLDVAAGLHKVLIESGRDEVFTALENIAKYKGGVRIEQFKVFKHYVKKGMREHRKDSTLYPATDNLSGQPTPRPRPVAYVSSFHMNTMRPSSADTTAMYDNAFQSHLELDTSNAALVNNGLPTKLALHSPSTAEPSITDLPSEPLPDLSPKKHVSRKRRSSSDSSLSSAQSLPSDYIATEESVIADYPSEEPPTAVIAQRQAPIRAASSRATRLSGMDQISTQLPIGANPLGHQHITLPVVGHVKKQKSRAINPETLEKARQAEAEIENRRKEYGRGVEQNYNYRDVPEIEERTTVDYHKHMYPYEELQPYRGPPPPVIHPNALLSSTIEVSSPASQQGGFLTVNGTSKKRNYDQYASDDESVLSSPARSISSPLPIPHLLRMHPVTDSRASTPRAARTTQASTVKRARTMISPRKQKNGANNLGAARAGVGKETALTNGADASGEDIDNEDQCRSCGEEGTLDHELLCCDGCPNSFHGDCLDPALDPSTAPDSWFCPECESKGKPQIAPSTGLMGDLIDHIDNAYPRSYNLPLAVRDYFENVKTGEQGEYVEVPVAPTNRKGAPRADNNGALRPPDYKAERDNKGNFRRCYKCDQTTEGKREMIPCDFCPNEWHIDCLSPPAAVIPKHFNIAGKPAQAWRCPLHIDDDLKEIGRSMGAAPGQLGRRPRLRRPKNAVAKEPDIPRSFANNGVIDIQLDPEQPDLHIQTKDMGGTIYKVTEQQIKLDFISAARHKFYLDHTTSRSRSVDSTKFHTKSWLPDVVKYRSTGSIQDSDESDNLPADSLDPRTRFSAHLAKEEAILRLRSKPLVEQQTVLTLAQMADGGGMTNGATNAVNHVLAASKLDALVNQLVVDAPDEVVAQATLSEEEQLEKLMALANQRLKFLRGERVFSKVVQQPTKMSKGTEIANPNVSAKVNGSIGHDHGDS